ncbi:MAG: FAD-dependent oxidoreductase [Candidatus Moranbacteria bacterium]|nr:FAD-dependent oxidoreductase [Candidatus Moranbacteria bacterium]
MQEILDSVIVGAGPSGLSASIYASRYKLNHVVLGSTPGGQMQSIHMLENWPGDISISGYDLISRMVDHVKHYGIEIKNEMVMSVEKNGDVFNVRTSSGLYKARTVIMAMGSEYCKLNIPGEKELVGRGVSYCATCDAMFFRNKVVSVVGGGNSAAVTALTLADHASKVYIIHRGEKLMSEAVWIDKLRNNDKIEIISGTSVIEIKGEGKVEKLVLDKPYNDKTFLETDGIFVAVGTTPGVTLAKGLGVKMDEASYIITNPDQSTNIEGIFAAGDITTGSDKFRQVITAAAEGAIAANGVHKLLKSR